MKIVSVVGARPQFIKIAPISKEIRKRHTEIIIHTGQHYHYKMSGIFFRELNIPTPDYNLKIGSGTHAEQTGKMLVGIEKILSAEQPDVVLVYGDTNSTIAGALASAKLGIPIAHIEAGLRSFNTNMPEEINRILTDRISQILFCPSDAAVQNLINEGIRKNVYLVGDVMLDLVRENIARIQKESKILETLNLQKKQYVLATVHRSNNADNIENLEAIFTALIESGEKIIMPLHPRTEKMLLHTGLFDKIKKCGLVKLVKPVSYFDHIFLESNAKKIITDSGGVQKEAYLLKVPCITLRNETEWIETLHGNWNILVGTDAKKILRAVKEHKPNKKWHNFYGYGYTSTTASKKIVEILQKWEKIKNRC